MDLDNEVDSVSLWRGFLYYLGTVKIENSKICGWNVDQIFLNDYRKTISLFPFLV